MDSARWQRLRRLFDAARERPRGERIDFVMREAGDDAELAAEVAALLEEESAVGDFLEPGVAPGSRLGSFTILSELGRGGMGIVYLAEQASPKRRVALKLLHAPHASPRERRRFEAESQILARLQHPGIAQVYESGTSATAAGLRPWFAMELVEGAPLTEHARRGQLATRERIALVVAVCDAVQHAHQKGVIHRDLKPSNILVDAAGRPRVLDFGVARTTDAGERLTTLDTDARALVGTLPYMSPEQVAGDARDLDTRCDVYALGVILYELLGGRLPHDVTRLALPEAVRRIAQDEPRRLAALDKRFRGDLDTIVAKALEKDRDRRYASARELARDLESYLAERPISAQPPSTVYELRKFARRNRALVAGGAAAVVALALGLAGTLWQAVEASEGRRVAEREATRARQTLAFVKQMLASVDPDVARGRDTTILRAMLDDAARRVESELAGEPEVEAELRELIASLYTSLGAYDAAESHARRGLELARAAGRRAPERLPRALHLLALVLRYRGSLDEAERTCREAAGAWRALAPPDARGLAGTLNLLGEVEFALSTQAATAAGGGDPRAAAEAAWREALDLQRAAGIDRDSEFARVLKNLALARTAAGDLEEARRLDEEALAILRAVDGDDSRSVATLLYQLADVDLRLGRAEDAEREYREALATYRRILPAGHAAIATTLRSLGRMHLARGDFASAETELAECVEIARAASADPLDLADGLHALARALGGLGRADDADRAFAEAVELYRANLPAGHPWIAIGLLTRGEALNGAGRAADAEPLLAEAASILRAQPPERARDLAACLLRLAEALEAQAKHRETVEVRRELHATLVKLYGEAHEAAVAEALALARALEAASEPDEAAEIRKRLPAE
jgi:tetratricopeptide (TPR) repeat protein/tRNA A-37 threonylcarbamoyl transferase component Bud32